MINHPKNNFTILREIKQNPNISQRELSAKLGISLGSANFCLRALISRGLVKINNFSKSDNKLAYKYLLTPQGIREKAKMTIKFLDYKLKEYEILKNEIKALQDEATKNEIILPKKNKEDNS